MLIGVIVAYGQSRRMGFDKLMQPLAGKTILQRTIDALLAHTSIERLLVVTPQARFEQLEFKDSQLQRVTRIDGGESRQASVQSALDFVQTLDTLPNRILIHDGARPLLSYEDLDALITASVETPSIATMALATRITDTIKQQSSSGTTNSIDRESLWAIQTPQIFTTELLMRAYQVAQAEGLTLTDEISAIESLKQPVHFIEPSSLNLKLTNPQDFQLAQAWLDTSE